MTETAPTPTDGVASDEVAETTAAAQPAARTAIEGGDAGPAEAADDALTDALTDAPADEPDGSAAASDDEPRLRELEREGDIAADYLEELLDIADLDGDIDLDVEGDRASVSIVGGDLGQLVGRDGEVLEALQELTRLAVLRETGERSRLMLDIGGHRAARRASVEDAAREAVARVQETREPAALRPMTPFERKVAHDVVAAAGLRSDSEGVEPERYVIVKPA